MLVDDDQQVRSITELLLKELGYDVTACPDAQTALNQHRTGALDLVLTDIVMPGMSGIDLLVRLKERDPDLPVILMTGFADLEKAVEAIKSGAFDFLVKPFSSDQLSHAVGKALTYRRLTMMEKDYQRMLEEFNQEVESLIAERTMNLMALALADKIRNPASVIGMTCRKLLRKESLDQTLQQGVMDILTQSERLEQIVRDFQELLTSRTSKFRCDDLISLVQEAIDMLLPEAAEAGVSLNFTSEKGPLLINQQRHLLKVAVNHIIRNAIEATPSGGIVSLSTSAAADHVRLEIADTGRGMDTAEIERAFEPFFSSKKNRFGMGLALAKQIITEHMGSIAVESAPGKGTRVALSFPVRWKESAPACSVP